MNPVIPNSLFRIHFGWEEPADCGVNVILMTRRDVGGVGGSRDRWVELN